MTIKLLIKMRSVFRYFLWGVALQFIFNMVLFASGTHNIIHAVPNPGNTLDVTVSGTVTDDQGELLPGVNIIIKGTSVGTITDIDGKFSIQVPEGSTLIFSFIGYTSKEIFIDGSRTVINVQLEADITSLEEVVVVGYGEQKKASVVGSISQTKGEDLLSVGSVNTVSEALQGMMPGVVAINSNSKPGSDAANIIIRGKSSWGSNQPLTLVDGVERNINDVDPNEIQNVSVLKDASATAVYGVRGANGVILITTRRGETGKPKIGFSANFGFKQPTAKITYANHITAMERYNEAAINDKLWNRLIPESEIEAWRQHIDEAGPYNQYFPQINWWDELTNDYGYQQRYNINVRGGTKFVKYFTSLGYLNDGDIYNTRSNPDFDPSFGYKRYNWRSNLDFDLTKTTRFSVNLSGKFAYRNQPGYRISGGGEDGYGQSQFMDKIYTSPTNLFPLKYEDGEWGESLAGEHNMILQMNEGGQRIYKYYEGFYDASLKQDLDFITQGLSFKAKLAYTSGSNYQSSILREGIGGKLSGIDVIRYYREFDYTKPFEGKDGTVQYPLIREIRWPDDMTQEGVIKAAYDEIYGYHERLYYEFSTNYSKSIGKHDVSGLLLMNRQIDVSNGLSANVPFPRYREDWVARATYGYDNRYLFEVNGAYTGSEKFAPGKRFGFFPSYSVGWVISEEKFVKQFAEDVLSHLKIRYSYGKVGSDQGAPRFAYVQQYSSGGNIDLGLLNKTSHGPLYKEGRAANPNQTWETSTKQNLGVDIDLWDRFSGTIDVYKEERTGILMGLNTIPFWFGAQEPSANIGSTKNRGYELELTWNDRMGSDFRYWIRANYTHSENRIVYRDDPRDRPDYLKDAGKPIGWSSRLQTAGYYTSLDDIYNYAQPSHGVPQGGLVPGDLMFVDYNADGQTNSLDEVAMENTTYPWTTYGLNLGFSYKNFDFNVLFYGVTNVSQNFPNTLLWDFNGNFVTAQPNVNARWTPENAANAEKPALHLNNHGHSQTRSTFSYIKGDYIRLKNAEVAYTIQSARLQKLGVSNFQIYANGNNLWTFTKMDSRIDPETSGTGVYPLVRRFNLGFRASF